MITVADTIQSLLCRVTRLRSDQIRMRSETAPDFNLFRILGVENDEVHAHSAFLAHLFDPNGAHAQGNLFLQEFLGLKELGLLRFAEATDWCVSTELQTSEGRLDIVLQSRTAKSIVVIENKIGTSDFEGQLNGYRRWLDAKERKMHYSHRKLVYLTPTQSTPNAAEDCECITISYAQHISLALTRASGKIRAAKVRENIEAYLQTIKKICKPGESLFMDALDQKIIDSIITPEEKIAALRLARAGEILQREMIRGFWDEGRKFISKQLKAFSGKWVLTPIEPDFCQITVIASGTDETRPHPRFVFNQYFTNSLFRLELAITLNGRVKNSKRVATLPEEGAVSKIMEDRYGMRPKHGWDCYRLVNGDDEEDVKQTLEREIVSGFYSNALFREGWNLFSNIEPQLVKLSTALQPKTGKST